MTPLAPKLAATYCVQLDEIASLLTRLAQAFTNEQPAERERPDWLLDRADTCRHLITHIEPTNHVERPAAEQDPHGS